MLNTSHGKRARWIVLLCIAFSLLCSASTPTSLNSLDSNVKRQPLARAQTMPARRPKATVMETIKRKLVKIKSKLDPEQISCRIAEVAITLGHLISSKLSKLFEDKSPTSKGWRRDDIVAEQQDAGIHIISNTQSKLPDPLKPVLATQEQLSKFAIMKHDSEETLVLNVGDEHSLVSGLVTDEYIFRFAQYCAIVYCELEQAQQMSGVKLEPGKDKSPTLLLGDFDVYDWVNVDGFRYNIVVNEKQGAIVVAFRGTANARNWFTDAKAWMTKPSSELFGPLPLDSEIHAGFQDAVKLIMKNPKSNIVCRIKDALKAHPEKHVVFTGHSLGGALAFLLFAAIFITEPSLQPHMHAVFTYGQPIVGNEFFSTHLTGQIHSKRVVRIVSGGDIVPFMNFNGWRKDDLPPAAINKHPDEIVEIWSRSPSETNYAVCHDADKDACAEGNGCGERRWKDHSVFGGQRITRRFCVLRNENAPLPSKTLPLQNCPV